MHELGIASDLITLVEQAMAQAPGAKLKRVHLVVGRFRGVEPDALHFAFETLTRDVEHLTGADLVIEEMFPAYRCRLCGEQGRLKDYALACPACDGPEIEVSGGDEILLRSIEVEEPE
ncbi:MAG: hydrogenase maturation nickel metallochaperone HypA/HybF [Planctomycetota bacterium]|jgi:hydrogenase nickel incorporation protein HypA/HybF